MANCSQAARIRASVVERVPQLFKSHVATCRASNVLKGIRGWHATCIALARSRTLRFNGNNFMNSFSIIDKNFSPADVRSRKVIYPARSLASRAERTSVSANSEVSKECPASSRSNQSLSDSRTSSFTMIAESKYIVTTRVRLGLHEWFLLPADHRELAAATGNHPCRWTLSVSVPRGWGTAQLSAHHRWWS